MKMISIKEQFAWYYRSYREFAAEYGTKSSIHAAFMALHTTFNVRKANRIVAKLTVDDLEKNKSGQKTALKDFISEIKGINFVWNKYSEDDNGLLFSKYFDYTYKISVFGIIDQYRGFMGVVEKRFEI